MYKKDFHTADVFLGFVVAKISQLRSFRKTLKVLLECQIYSENGRGKESRENSRPLDVELLFYPW